MRKKDLRALQSFSKKTPTAPLSKVNTPTPKITPPDTKTLWEVPFIDSSQVLYTECGIYHYEMMLTGYEKDNKYYSMSRVKFCPKTIEYKGVAYDFFNNPVDKVSRLPDKYPDFSINWGEYLYNHPVTIKKDLKPDVQEAVHKKVLEEYIVNEWWKEPILKALDSIAESL